MLVLLYNCVRFANRLCGAEILAKELAQLIATVVYKNKTFCLSWSLQVSSAAVKCATSLCATLANPDLIPHIPVLVKCMIQPDSVPACIKALSNTTFVAEVTSPALAVLVPLLLRALNDRSSGGATPHSCCYRQSCQACTRPQRRGDIPQPSC